MSQFENVQINISRLPGLKSDGWSDLYSFGAILVLALGRRCGAVILRESTHHDDGDKAFAGG